MKSYYIDTCIYLNLWQKEVDDSGAELWKYAKELFEKIEIENSIIYYSGFLLKELMFILSTKEYLDKRELFDSSNNFKKVFLSKEEFEIASKMKRQTNDLSFYDIIHIILTKKSDSILITRDKKMTEFAKTLGVIVKKPEEIL